MQKITSLVLFGALMITCRVALAQDTIRELFPNSKTVWERNYQGELKDFVIIEDTEDIIALTQEIGKYHLYYFNSGGELLWERTNPLVGGKWGVIDGLNVSQNGQTIIVHASDSDSERSQTWVYDNTGNLLFSDLKAKGLYYTSPNGEYLVFQRSLGSTSFAVYDRYGSILNMNIPEILQTGRQKLRFVSENEVLVYRESKQGNRIVAELVLVTIPNGSIKWKKELDSPLWLIDFNERNCAVWDDYIAIQGTKRPAAICLLRKEDGSVVWEIDEPQSNHGLAFLDNGKLLVSLAANKFLFVIDTESGEILNELQLFDWGGIDGVPKFSFSKGKIAIYGSSGGLKDERLDIKDIVTGIFSSVISFGRNWNVVEKKLMPAPIAVHVSKRNSKAYVIGQIQKDKGILTKIMEER